MNRKYIVDSGEKDYVYIALDMMNIDYEVEEIKLYFCEDCDKIYKEKPEKCECGSVKIKYERVADMVIVDAEGNWMCAIERKLGEDLYASLDDRVYEQMEKLAKYFKGNIAIVFEGDLEELALAHPERAGQILSIPASCMQYGVSFINTQDISETIKILQYFFYKVNTPPKQRTKRFHYHSLLAKNQIMFMSIFKCGLKSSLTLAKKYKSITDFGIDLRTRNLHTIASELPGIGVKTLINYSEWVI